MNFRNKHGNVNLKIVIGIVIVLIVGVIIILLNSNKKNSNKSLGAVTYEYFVFYSIDDEVGVIDKKGNEIIKAEYTDIYIPNPSNDVFICFNDNKYIILNSEGKEIFKDYEDISVIMISESTLEMEKEVLKYKDGELYGFISLSGEKITDAIYEEISSLKNKPGYILVKKDGYYGVLDINGKKVIDIEYNSIKGDEYCSEDDGYEKTGYIVSAKTDTGIFYGYIDYKGKTILKTKYESITRVLEYNQEDIYLIIMDGGKKGVFKNNKQIIGTNFQSINYSSLSKIFIVERTSKYGFYNNEGKEILKPEYTSYSIAGNYISVQKEEQMMLYDIHGNLVNSNKYTSIIETDNPSYFIAQDEKGYYSVISKDVEIEDEYVNINYAFDDYFIFTNKDNKSGVINIWKGTIIEAQYDYILVTGTVNALEARNYDVDTVDIYSKNIEKVLTIGGGVVENIGEDYVVIYSDTEMKYIDKNGEIVENTEVYPDLKLYSIQANEKWGFCNTSGEVIVECKYDMVTEMNQYGFAGIKQDGKWGVIDEEGNIVVDAIYEIESYYFPKFIGKYQLQEMETVHCIEIE